MIRLIIIAVLLVLLMDCSSLAKKAVLKAIVPSSEPKPLVQVETVVGNKSEAIIGSIGSIGSKSEVKADVISGGVSTNYIQQVPFTFMILLILGWMLPTPRGIYLIVMKRLNKEPTN